MWPSIEIPHKLFILQKSQHLEGYKMKICVFCQLVTPKSIQTRRILVTAKWEKCVEWNLEWHIFLAPIVNWMVKIQGQFFGARYPLGVGIWQLSAIGRLYTSPMYSRYSLGFLNTLNNCTDRSLPSSSKPEKALKNWVSNGGILPNVFNLMESGWKFAG